MLLLSCFSHVRLFVTHGPQPARLPCPWDFPGKDTGVGCMPSSRGPSRPRDRTFISYVSFIGRWVLDHECHLGSTLLFLLLHLIPLSKGWYPFIAVFLSRDMFYQVSETWDTVNLIIRLDFQWLLSPLCLQTSECPVILPKSLPYILLWITGPFLH